MIAMTAAGLAEAQTVTRSTTATPPRKHAPESWLGIDGESFVALSFLIFIAVLLYLRVPRMIAAALDARTLKIRGELDEAKRLRADAEALLAGYQAKAATAAQDAEAILAGARAEAANIVADAHTQAKASIVRRTRVAETKISAATRAAEAEVRAHAVDIASAAARRLIDEGSDPAEQARLTSAAITELERRLR